MESEVPNEEPRLTLEVGKTYVTRGGRSITIDRYEGHSTYPFYGEDQDGASWSFTPDGTHYRGETSPLDLVSLAPCLGEDDVFDEVEDAPRYPKPLSDLLDTFDTVVNNCRSTMLRKNHDYTSGSEDVLSNFRASEMFGIPLGKGILLRMGDKMKRIQTFVEQGTLQVQNESARDAVEDLVNYAILLAHSFEQDD